MNPDVDLFALSNLRSSETGVGGVVISISAGEFLRGGSTLGPRVEVVLGDQLAAEGLKSAVSVLLSDPPEVRASLPPDVERQVLRFATANREALLRHWYGEIDTGEAVGLLVVV